MVWKKRKILQLCTGIEAVVVNLWRYWGCLNNPFDISITGIVFESLYFTNWALINNNRYRWKKTICPVGCDKKEKQPIFFLQFLFGLSPLCPVWGCQCTQDHHMENIKSTCVHNKPHHPPYMSAWCYFFVYIIINRGLFIVRPFSSEVLLIILLRTFIIRGGLFY